MTLQEYNDIYKLPILKMTTQKEEGIIHENQR